MSPILREMFDQDQKRASEVLAHGVDLPEPIAEISTAKHCKRK